MVVADAVPTALGVFVVSGFCPDLFRWVVPSLQTLICSWMRVTGLDPNWPKQMTLGSITWTFSSCSLR